MQAIIAAGNMFTSPLQASFTTLKQALIPVLRLPTRALGIGASAVKASATRLMLATANMAQREPIKYRMWSSEPELTRRVILYPMDFPRCRHPERSEWVTWQRVMDNVNRGLAEWQTELRFEINQEPQALGAEQKQNGLRHHPWTIQTVLGQAVCVYAAVCEQIPTQIGNAGGSTDSQKIRLLPNAPLADYAHELAHLVAPHPFDVVDMASLHPDLQEALCTGGAHGPEFLTTLNYADKCARLGYPESEFWEQHWKKSGTWGPIEFAVAKLAMNRHNASARKVILKEGVQRSYEWIEENYGDRLTGQFAAAFIESVIIHLMSAAFVRCLSDEPLPEQVCLGARAVIQLYARLVQALYLLSDADNVLVLIASLTASSGLLSKTVSALVGLTGEVALVRAFHGLLRGNADAIYQLAYALAGQEMGALAGQAVYWFVDRCSPAGEQRRKIYVQLTRPSGVGESCLAALSRTVAPYLPATCRTPAALKKLRDLDQGVADFLVRNLSLSPLLGWASERAFQGVQWAHTRTQEREPALPTAVEVDREKED